MKDTYIKKKQQIRQTGNSRQYWEYFDMMDRTLGTKQNTQPSANRIGDTITAASEQVTFDSSDDENIALKPPKKKSRLDLEHEKFEWKKRTGEKLLKTQNEQTELLKELIQIQREKNN